MKPSEAAFLLSAIARTDRRTISESEARSWAELLTEAGVPLADALDAVKYHFGHCADYLMPIHIINRVKDVRQERLSRAGTPPMPGYLTWKQERDWRRLWCGNVKDGMSIEAAAVAASEAMNLPRELPPAPDAVADERKALVQKLADSKAAPRAKPEDLKPKKRKPRTRWGCWSRGDVVPATPDNDEFIAFHPGGRVLYHDLGPYGINIDTPDGLRGDLKFWLHHIAGKGWGDLATLTQLGRAWAHITDATEDEYAQAIVWVSEAIDQEREDETFRGES